MELNIIEWIEKVQESSKNNGLKKLGSEAFTIAPLKIPMKTRIFRILKAYLIRRCVISLIYVLIGLLIYFVARLTSRHPNQYQIKYVVKKWPVVFLRIFSSLRQEQVASS